MLSRNCATEQVWMVPVYERGNTIVRVMLAVHLVLAFALGAITNTVGAAWIVAVPAAAAFVILSIFAPYAFATRSVAGIALMAMYVLHLYQLGGIGRGHFFFFTAVLAMMSYKDHRALYPAAMVVFAYQVLLFTSPAYGELSAMVVATTSREWAFAIHVLALAGGFGLAAIQSHWGEQSHARLCRLRDELSRTKRDLQRDIERREWLEGQLQETVAELQTKVAAMEFNNSSLSGELGRLEDLANCDGLTGLPNVINMRARLEEMLLAAGEVSVVMMDIDHFKQHNDLHGHQHGDEVLREVAQIMASKLRDNEIVGRYGGEEFIVILPKCSAEHALMVAERLRKAIDEAEWPVRAVTASFGVATRHEEWRSGEELIGEADHALYASKRQGRNRVSHARDLENAA